MELKYSDKTLADLVQALVYLYILTIPFHTLGLRFIGLHIGLPEIVFIILVPLAIIHIIRSGKKLWIDKLDFFVFGWLIATIIVGWHTGFYSIVVNEIIKTAYLVVLYIILKWIISSNIITQIVEVILLSSLIAALTGIIGFGFGYIGIDTFLIIKRPFPYGIENVLQAKGFTPSPHMLASIIMIGVFIQLQKFTKNKASLNRKDYLIVPILLIGFLLTFSKIIVCLLIGIILILYFNYKSILSNSLRFIAITSVGILFIVYIFGTHFIIVEKNQDYELLKGDYIAGPALTETAYYSIYPSQYWSLKEISIKAIGQSFPWGLGSGKFNEYAHELKNNDLYPTHVPYPDPHSTYFGILAENGLLGLIALGGIIFFVTIMSRNILKENSHDSHFITCLPPIFITIAIEAVCTDVMNFRHYWILLILLASSFESIKLFSWKRQNL